MSALLTKGRKDNCKNAVGGIKTVYFSPFQYFSRNRFIIDGVTLVTIPASIIYLFEVSGNANSFAQNYDGAGFYNQSLNIQFSKQDLESKEIMESLQYMEYRIILELNDGSYRILGLENAMTCESLNITTGETKTAFAGYSLQFSGKERLSALYVDDLTDAGFLTPEDALYYQFQDFSLFNFQDGSNYEFQF